MGIGDSRLRVKLALAGQQLNEKSVLVRGRARSIPNEPYNVEFG
jgi:hypothetical protein